MEDFIKHYDLEKYLFEDVNQKFHQKGYLDAYDFFCILIWKAERAKIYHVRRLTNKFPELNLDNICKKITISIFERQKNIDKMSVLIEDFGFLLPTASSILSVLYPDNFTVYDIRVCDQLKCFHNLDNLKFENRWNKYIDYIEKVKEITPNNLSLRDKDKYLWGKSFKEQLEKSISNKFSKE